MLGGSIGGVISSGSYSGVINVQPIIEAKCQNKLSWIINLVWPFCPSNGFKYIFTAVCAFSKYVVAVPIRNKEATTVAKALFDNVFLHWGTTFEVLSDFGTEFENELARELYKLLGI